MPIDTLSLDQKFRLETYRSWFKIFRRKVHSQTFQSRQGMQDYLDNLQSSNLQTPYLDKSQLIPKTKTNHFCRLDFGPGVLDQLCDDDN